MSVSSQDTTDCFENIKKLLKEVVDAAAAGLEREEEWEMKRARGRERETEEGLLTKLGVETEKNESSRLRMKDHLHSTLEKGEILECLENERIAHVAQKAEWEARMEIHQVYLDHIFGQVKLCRDARGTQVSLHSCMSSASCCLAHHSVSEVILVYVALIY